MSGPQTIAYNSETVRDRPKFITNREWEVGYWISESALIFDLGRQLVEKWANNSETVRDRPKVIINRKYEVWVCLSETVLTFDIQRHLAERMALRHLR